jgi:predicted nucleotidyltransferase
MFNPKDFIETTEGLVFAVVDARTEQGKVLCFLRYVREDGGWRKKATEEANLFLRHRHTDYLHYSEMLDAHLHAVEMSRIVEHHQPRRRLRAILEKRGGDAVESDLFQLAELLSQHGVDLAQVGVTGSVLIGVQRDSSDIDLVCYGREGFLQCREVVRQLIEQGQLQSLSDSDWRESYRRRGCSLGYGDYVWHERRKYNKAVVNGRKFDLSLIEQNGSSKPELNKKLGPVTLRCRITDDSRAFDYPAVYRIASDSIGSIVCFTATYAGQAFNGEVVEVSGLLEEASDGSRHIVVGSSREAYGEHIMVIHD